MITGLRELFPDADIISDQLPDYILVEQDGHLVLAGSADGIKKGIAKFLQGGLLKDFRFVRSLYRDNKTKDMVLDSLAGTREKIRDVLKEHYGDFDYSPYESAFDEYLVAMREEQGITITDKQVHDHAGVGSKEELRGKGYQSAHKYILDRMDYREREAYITANGGMSYHDWVEKEIDRFTAEPALLIRKYSAVFENIFPKTVTVDAAAFIIRFSTLDTALMAELVFGSKAQQDAATAAGTRFILVTGIPREFKQYWT